MDAENNTTEPADENNAEETQPEVAEETHSLKADLREGAAKAFGIAVELGSILGGSGGDIVEAQREVAEAEAEELLDRIDGEG